MHESDENLKLLPWKRPSFIFLFFFRSSTAFLEMISSSDTNLSDLFYPEINSTFLTETKRI